MRKTMKAALAIAAAVATAVGTALPAAAADTWTYSWNGVVKFTTFKSGSAYYGRLYDIKGDGVPVRAQYHRTNDTEYNIYNSNGVGTHAQTPLVASRIDWVIECNDYLFGDDCSPKHYG